MNKTINLRFFLFLAPVILFFAMGCTAGNTKPDIQPKYYIADDHYDEMTIGFVIKNDTVHIWYLDIIDHGNYLNSTDDTTDYAGSFLMNEIKNDEVDVTIKSYRDETQKYPVHLRFSKDWRSFSWEVKTGGPVSYLPKTATFRTYKTTTSPASFAGCGRYSGALGFYTDTIKGIRFAVIGSSASQVYEGDASFDCTLLLIEDSVGRRPDASFVMYNVSDTIPIACGKATIHTGTDTTLILSFRSDSENTMPCAATIDFKDTYTLVREINTNLTEVDKTGRGTVTAGKSFFHKAPDVAAITKGYLIKDDKVAVLDIQNDWTKVVYIKADGQPYVRWMKTESLQINQQ